MTDKLEQDPKTGRFLPGNSGFGGKPKGARNKLGEAFIQALHESFLEHGPETIETVRTEKPDAYLKVIASLMPKEHRIDINDQFSEMTDDELAQRIRSLTAQLAPFLTGGLGEREEGVGSEAGEAKPPKLH